MSAVFDKSSAAAVSVVVPFHESETSVSTASHSSCAS